MASPPETSPSEEEISQLVLRALELPDGEQRAYLESACGDDAALFEAAWRWLRAEDELGDFLESPAADGLEGITGAGDLRQLTAGASQVTSQVTVSDLPESRHGSEARGNDDETTWASGQAQGPAAGDGRASGGWSFPSGEQRLGAYPIVAHLGEGGMGQVYIGEDARLGRRVAIKVLPPEMALRPGWLERFEREARALATLNHPNIVTIHSIEEDAGVRFLTMELIEGRTLAEQIPPGGFDLETLLEVSLELTGALAAAHERGVVHRDLKPANVMVTREGRAKILDFGIAKLQGPNEPNVSQPGSAIGTLAYMSPEQVQGLTVDARSDLFSLGILIFRMATGEHPFPATTFNARVTAILTHDPPPLLEHRPDLPTELETIVARCLEKEPSERYANAGELRRDLQRLREQGLATRLLESRSDLAPPPPRPRRSLAATVSLLALLILAGLFVLSRSPPAPPPEAPALVERRSLAIEPFRNLSGKAEVDWLRDGIAELLGTDLAQSPEIELVEEDRDELDHVLRGSFVMLGETLRIAVSLEDPGNGEIVHAASVEGRGQESLFELVDQVSAGIRAQFAVRLPGGLAPDTVQQITTHSIEAWRAYTAAQELYQSSRVDEARQQLQTALELDPEFALALAMLAQILRSIGESQLAESYAEQSVALASHLPLHYRFDAETAFYGTKWSTTGRAIETYQLALKLYPNAHGFRNNLARRLAFFERYEDAIRELEQLIESDEQFWGNYYSLANAHAALGEFAVGERLLQRFIEQEPENWLAIYALAWHQTEWGHFDDAAATFARVAELRPEAFQLRYGRWRLESLAGRLDAAEAEAAALLERDETFARWRGHVSRARNALLRGSAENAGAGYAAAIELSSGADRALARVFLAELLLLQGRVEEARGEARLAQQDGAGQWPELRGYFFEALAEQALGRRQQAETRLELLRQHWRRQPNAVEERQIAQLLGLLHLGRGEAELGLEQLRRAAALLPARGVEFSWHVFPHHVPIWTALGEAELAAGRPEAAVAWLVSATGSVSERLEQPLSWVRAHYLLGLAYHRSGQPDRAAQSFRRFLEHWEGGDLQVPSVALARSFLDDRASAP